MNLKRKAYFLIGFFFFSSSLVAQEQKIADSLAIIYKVNTLSDTAKLELLRNLAFNEGSDLALALRYAEELVTLSIRLKNNVYLHRAYLQIGNKKRLLGNLDEALEFYFKSREAARLANLPSGEGAAYSAIADIYSISNNHHNAMLYYHKAISTLRQSGDSVKLASALSNAGDEYLNSKNYDSALLFFNESKLIFDKKKYLSGMGYSLGNIGMAYASQGNNRLAEKNMNYAIQILEASGDYYPICVYLVSIADIYQQNGDEAAVLRYLNRSLALAQQYGLKEQISDANLKLSEFFERSGNAPLSFQYFKNHIAYRDSLENVKSVQKMADLRTNFEVSQKQIEVDLLNQEKRNQRIINVSLFIILGLATVLLGTLFWYYRNIAREKKRSEGLLLNILPEATAKELKLRGKVDAVKFEEVTVLFTDFVEFSKSAELISPEQLVRSIDFYFRGFDDITSKYELEKIKTIGDSYMCAGGLPNANPLHSRNAVLAATEMINLVNKEMNENDGLHHFEIRIGIHTGPVVAGIVGSKKWQYDIWGDAVNVASRMEANSKPGKINLSETTYQLIKDEFHCEYRGEFDVKNKGRLKMYFLS